MTKADENKLKAIMKKFEALDFAENSIQELKRFFEFEINYLNSKRSDLKIRYNFLFQYETPEEAELFFDLMEESMQLLNEDFSEAWIYQQRELQRSENYNGFEDENPIPPFVGIYLCETPPTEDEINQAEASPLQAEMREKRNKMDNFWNRHIPSLFSEDIIIAAGNSSFISYMKDDDERFSRFFAHHLYIRQLSVKEILERTEKQLTDYGFHMDDSFISGITRYIETVYPKADLKNQPFVKDLVNRILVKYYQGPQERLTSQHVPYYRQSSSLEEVFEELNGMIGLTKIKKGFETLYYLAQDPEQNVQKRLTFLFAGNPGTGKTTVAKTTARLLCGMGLIKSDKLVVTSRKDLVGKYVGHSGANMRRKIKEAYGGVLFIDEAYFMAQDEKENNPFGKECLEVLLDEMENSREKFAVILAGYKNELEKLKNSNPGLSERIAYQFEFEDYTEEELLQIFIEVAAREHMTLDEDAYEVMRQRIAYAKAQKHFANARTIENIYQELKGIWIQKKRKERVITAEDILDTMPETTTEDLEGMIGLEQVKDELHIFEKRVSYLKYLKERDVDVPNSNMHMLFTGNPGTGKTTVARRIADYLYNIGMLTTNHLEIAERKDLVSTVRGGSAKCTNEIIERAKNGVLFIDEAYSLVRTDDPGDPGTEVIETLLTAMETYKDCLVVIFAGYRDEMRTFLDSNPGLSSRIGYQFYFPDYTSEELTEMFYKKMDGYGFHVKDAARKKVMEDVNYYSVLPNFGNGRFIDQLIDRTINKRASRNYNKTNYNIIYAKDIPTIKELSDGRRVPSTEDLSEEERRSIAVHEAGHALVGKILNPDQKIEHVSIRSDAVSLGNVALEANASCNTEMSMKIRLAVCFAGRNAERVFFGDQSSGCLSDIDQAKRLATAMIQGYAMGDFGHTSEMDLLMEADRVSTEIITENKDIIEKIVDRLMKREQISGDEFERLIRRMQGQREPIEFQN